MQLASYFGGAFDNNQAMEKILIDLAQDLCDKCIGLVPYCPKLLVDEFDFSEWMSDLVVFLGFGFDTFGARRRENEEVSKDESEDDCEDESKGAGMGAGTGAGPS